MNCLLVEVKCRGQYGGDGGSFVGEGAMSVPLLTITATAPVTPALLPALAGFAFGDSHAAKFGECSAPPPSMWEWHRRARGFQITVRYTSQRCTAFAGILPVGSLVQCAPCAIGQEVPNGLCLKLSGVGRGCGMDVRLTPEHHP